MTDWRVAIRKAQDGLQQLQDGVLEAWSRSKPEHRQRRRADGVLGEQIQESSLLERPSPHDLRRSCISDLLDRGNDLAVVQRLAGHASPVTTARYDRRPDAAARRAAETLTVPFVPAG